jgi:adenylate cyclase
MQLAMREVNEENRRNGFPELEMGIALNTGECVVGNIGSQKRAKYGVVGSHVNLTARIESYTVGGQVLISRSTADAVGTGLKLGDQLQLGAKGFREPITVFELLGLGGNYGLELPERSEDPRALVREIPIHVEIIEGKQLAGGRIEGRLLALSMREAMVSCASSIEPLSNLRVRFTGLNGVIVPGDLYAKVIDSEEGRCRLRFTSIPDEIKSFIRSTLASEVQ